jgi:uroporphyrinogen-III synthase
VTHVPLIEIVDARDGGAALAKALERADDLSWLVVTSKHGARRVGAEAARVPHVRLAAVGTRTAAELAALAGRPVDLVPNRQTAADLADSFPDPCERGERVLIAQADLADDHLVSALADRGYVAESVVAYSTRLRTPTATELASLVGADAVAFASGSAARAWVDAVGTSAPPIVVAIGPTTADVARAAGLQVSAVAADHTVEGLAAEISAAFGRGT